MTELRRLLADAQALLLDFDGPICSVFAGIPASAVAQQLRDVLTDGGHTHLPTHIRAATDPFDILRYAATLSDDDARYVEAAFTAHELEAIPTATPTDDAHDLITAWHATGRPVAVVSNNSTQAVESYIQLHNLHENIAAIAARTAANLDRLKPDPYLLKQACATLAQRPQAAILIGDSLSDINAGRGIGCSILGYANKSGKANQLAAAGADRIITRLIELRGSITSTRHSTPNYPKR